MESLKYPKGWIKKGIAHFNTGDYTTAIANGSPIPVCNIVTFNNSINISVVSSTRIQLKANVLYKLTGQLSSDNASSGYLGMMFYNVTSSSYVGIRGLMMPSSSTSNSTYGVDAFLLIAPTVDTVIELRLSGLTTITTINSGSSVLVEELEGYIMPVPKALDMMIGVNQILQNITTSRVMNTNYTNTTEKPIYVIVTHSLPAGNSSQFFINDTIVSEYGNNTNYTTNYTHAIIIPSGSTYRLASVVIGTIVKWNELK